MEKNKKIEKGKIGASPRVPNPTLDKYYSRRMLDLGHSAKLMCPCHQSFPFKSCIAIGQNTSLGSPVSLTSHPHPRDPSDKASTPPSLTHSLSIRRPRRCRAVWPAGLGGGATPSVAVGGYLASTTPEARVSSRDWPPKRWPALLPSTVVRWWDTAWRSRPLPSSGEGGCQPRCSRVGGHRCSSDVLWHPWDAWHNHPREAQHDQHRQSEHLRCWRRGTQVRRGQQQRRHVVQLGQREQHGHNTRGGAASWWSAPASQRRLALTGTRWRGKKNVIVQKMIAECWSTMLRESL
jgi:hypothetical protein